LRVEEEARFREEEETRRRAEDLSHEQLLRESAQIEAMATASEETGGAWLTVNLDHADNVDALLLSEESLADSSTNEADVEVSSHSEETVKEIDVLDADKGIAVAQQEKGIEHLGDDSSIPAELLKKFRSDDVRERVVAVAELSRIGGDDAFLFITRAFDDPDQEVRSEAARALYEAQADRAASFTRALREGSPERRRNIGAALADSGLANDAISNLTGESREKTYDAFSLLFLMAKAGQVQPLMQAIEDHENIEIRLAVVKLLALSGQPEIVPAFRRLAVRGSLPSDVRSAVMEAIYQISSQAREIAPSAA
jgi:hypothetical protein